MIDDAGDKIYKIYSLVCTHDIVSRSAERRHALQERPPTAFAYSNRSLELIEAEYLFRR